MLEEWFNSNRSFRLINGAVFYSDYYLHTE